MTSTDLSEHQPDPTSAQPLLSVGTITAAGTALVGALVAFGLDLTDDQQAAILGIVAVIAPIVVAVWGRRRVYAPATVASLLAAARPRMATGVTHTTGQLPPNLDEQVRRRLGSDVGTII